MSKLVQCVFFVYRVRTVSADSGVKYSDSSFYIEFYLCLNVCAVPGFLFVDCIFLVFINVSVKAGLFVKKSEIPLVLTLF